MLPAFFTAVADRFFDRRWWLLAASALAIAVAVAALLIATPRGARVAIALMGPFITLPWGLLCACTWFDPQRGKLQPTSKYFGRLPPFIQTGVRWYAALFLSFFLVVGAILWPVFSVTWL